MNHTRTHTIARIAILALSIGATFVAADASASESYYGGGSTFAAPPYTGSDYLLTTPESRLSTNAGNSAGTGFTQAGFTAGSAFDAYTTRLTNQVSYCQTGSGFGKNSLNAAASAPANGMCNDYSVSPAGLSSPNILPDFIGTDSPYSTTDYNNFLAGPASVNQGVAQVPTMAGAIALPHGSSINTVKLNVAQVCRIYSGMYTSWKSIGGVTGTGNKGTITLVYRTDSSGTSFAFTRYLAANCNGTTNVPAGFVFTPNSTFNSAIPGGVTAVYGTRAVGASGNPGVVGATLDPTNPNAMGYADVGEVINESAGYALVAGYDPTQFGIVSGVQKPLTLAANQLLVGKVLDGATANVVPGSASQAIKNCTTVINPALKLPGTYPIVAFTYLDTYYSGNGTAAHSAGLRQLLAQFYQAANRPAAPQGYAYVNGNATFSNNVVKTINACVN